jgi:hypothetical protein
LIRLNPAFLGLLYGDGSLKHRISFSNTEPSLVCFVIENLREVTSSKIKLHVKTYGDPQQSLAKWREILSEYDPVFYKPTAYFGKRSKNDLAEVIIDDANARRALLESQRSALDEALVNKRFCVQFLQGLIAAEGSIKLFEDGALQEARVASVYSQATVRALLKTVGVKPANAVYDFYVAASGFPNFSTMKKHELFSLHPRKREKFELAFQKTLVKQGE